MPAPLNVDREAVRVLAAAIGQRAAARELGLNENTVKSICWYAGDGERVAAVLEKQVHPNSPKASEVMQEILADEERETRLTLSRAALKGAKQAEGDPLKHAKALKAIAEVAGITHKWGKDAGTTVNVSVGLRLEMD